MANARRGGSRYGVNEELALLHDTVATRTSPSPFAGRPEWVFVKVHTHGAPESQGAALLGEAGASSTNRSRRSTTGAREM